MAVERCSTCHGHVANFELSISAEDPADEAARAGVGQEEFDALGARSERNLSTIVEAIPYIGIKVLRDLQLCDKIVSVCACGL
jgi:hypothetical protein